MTLSDPRPEIETWRTYLPTIKLRNKINTAGTKIDLVDQESAVAYFILLHNTCWRLHNVA